MQLATEKAIVLASLAIALVGLVVAAPAAQAPIHLPEEMLDHFKVYLFDPPATVLAPVTLTDQWGTEEHIVETLEKFSLNVSKNGSLVLDPTAHLSWWTIDGDGNDPVRTIVVKHQFGQYGLMVRQPRYLLAPAFKNTGGDPNGGPTSSLGLDHFKCYDAVGPPLGIDLGLQTQFGFESVVVGEPVYFCNPTEKTSPAGNVYPVANPAVHLTCYDIGPGQPGTATLGFTDQFIQWSGLLALNELLCIPSFKENVVPNEEKTWGELKSIYR